MHSSPMHSPFALAPQPLRSRLPSRKPSPAALAPRTLCDPTLTCVPPACTLALALANRSGQSVRVEAARYITHHDAEGIGAFLEADFSDLTSILSFTVEYLAGTPPHVDAARPVACTPPQPGAWLACGVFCAPVPPSPRVNSETHHWTHAQALSLDPHR